VLGLRRVLAVLLLPLVGVAFLVALLAGRVDGTVLNPDFVTRHAEQGNLYVVFHQEGIPALVSAYVDSQEERLPDNLAAANLPTDLESRRRMAEVVQSMLPPEFMQQLVEGFVGGFLPFMAGKRDGFDVAVSLHEPLIATFGSESDGRSLFEAMWLDLNMSERLIRSFAEARLEEAREQLGTPEETPIDEQGLLDILAQDIEGSAAWWDEEFLGLIRGMLPFLVGTSDEFEASIDFTPYPALAYAFSGPLQQEPEILQREGWRVTHEDLHRELSEAEDVTIADIDDALSIFRPGGMVFNDEDLRQRLEASRAQALEEGEESLPPNLDDQRQIVQNARRVTLWGLPLLTGVLVLAVAFLGGRGWTGRLRWGSVAVMWASVWALLITVPVYAALASTRVDRWLDERRADPDSNIPEPLRLQLFDQLRLAVGEFVGGMQWRAAAWFILGVLAFAFSVAWERPQFRDWVHQRISRLRGERVEVT